MKNNIVLIGSMAVGKTTIANIIAEHCNVETIDIDIIKMTDNIAKRFSDEFFFRRCKRMESRS